MTAEQISAWWLALIDDLVRTGSLTAKEAARARLHISSEPWLRANRRRPTCRGCRGSRHYAATDLPGGPVRLHADALELPGLSVMAILLHEVGHVLSGSKRWKAYAGDTDEERRADKLARVATGWRIRYDERLVQTLGPGVARPTDLR
jgi:hypothetical protein